MAAPDESDGGIGNVTIKYVKNTLGCNNGTYKYFTGTVRLDAVTVQGTFYARD